MGTTWVLHTETKGTGAQMVPLESITKRAPSAERLVVARKPLRRGAPREPEPKAARRFKIVNLMTRQVLAEGAGSREAVDELKQIPSVVDVNVYVWQQERARWRLLSWGEQRMMWELAHGPADQRSAGRPRAGAVR
jgi:hypothetical protein